MPDTEDEDSAAETFWPEGYKQVIREEVRQTIIAQLGDGKRFRRIYRQRFTEKYSDLGQFLDKITDMVAIGAENGADDAFEDVVDAFWMESPLPEERAHARYLWPQALPDRQKTGLWRVIIDEYSDDNVYQHAYKVGYDSSFATFDDYINHIARLVVTGTMNGADDMLATTYQAFVTGHPLPPARRHPRRLKVY